MAKITVTYDLSQDGQRANLLAGGDGRRGQTINVPEDHPLRADVIRLGRIGAEGNVTLATPDPSQHTYTSFEVSKSLGGWNGLDILDYTIDRVIAPWPADYPEGKSLGWGEPRTLEDLVPLIRELEDGRATSYAAAKAELAAAEEAAEEGNKLARAARKKAKEEAEEKRDARWAREKAKAEARLATATDWALEHGSERLQAIVTEGILGDSLAVYRDERLAAELPGWIWDTSWEGGEVEHRDPRNPPLEAMQLLAQAREELPDGCEGELVWAHYGDGNDDCGYYDDGDCVDPIREYAVLSHYLGRRVIRRS